MHHGVCTYDREELTHLAQAALDVPAGGLIVEIGTYTGCSASVLLGAARGRGVRVVLCDPLAWMFDAGAQQKLDWTLAQFPEVDIVKAIPMTSEECYAVFGAGDVDMVHIDGDHSVRGVTVDCELWLPRLRPGGLACFHDYRSRYDPDDTRFPGIAAAIDGFTEGWERVFHGGGYGLLVARKPGGEVT